MSSTLDSMLSGGLRRSITPMRQSFIKSRVSSGLSPLWLIINICISPVKERWQVPVDEWKLHVLMGQNGRFDSEVWRAQLMSQWRLPGKIFQLTHWQMIRLAVIETRALAGIVMPALICSDWESSAQDWEHWPRRRVKASYHRQKWNACKLLLRHLSGTVHSLCSCIRKGDIQSSVYLNSWKKNCKCINSCVSAKSEILFEVNSNTYVFPAGHLLWYLPQWMLWQCSSALDYKIINSSDD